MTKPHTSQVDGSKISLHPLLAAVQTMLPPAKAQGAQRMIVAQPARKKLLSAPLPVPADVEVQSYPLRGPREVRRTICYNGFYHGIANWPEARLIEARIPLVVCVTAGRANLHIADYVLTCSPGHFLVIPAGVPYGGIWRPHTAGATESEDCDVLAFCSWQGDAVHLHCWMDRSHNRRHCRTPYAGQIADPRADRYLRELIEEATDVNANARGAFSLPERLELCGSLWQAFLLALLREIKNDRVSDLRPEYSAVAFSRHSDKPIARAQEYILRNLSQPLTIDRAAIAVYMSRARFTVAFRQETGQSFNEYVTAQRLREARRMLRETNWPIRQIAKSVGLSLSRIRGLFHEHEGQSPAAYRRASSSQRKTMEKG
jgi:AraC-like DNA-binding protein